ncbi:hypothetical protein [Streptomyces sp. NPDC005407]|uniref:hypothetical protein n=1 Tax=Streptomyces sp. NPDC005407 TaxID=3155340 RepID=UPI0033AE97CE
MDLNREASAIAESASEEIRALNHRSLPGHFKQPADVYAVAESLATLIARMPQALHQLGRAVQDFQDRQAIRMDDGSDPAERVACVAVALADAVRGLEAAQAAMRRANSPLAGMGGYFTADEDGDEVGEDAGV